MHKTTHPLDQTKEDTTSAQVVFLRYPCLCNYETNTLHKMLTISLISKLVSKLQIKLFKDMSIIRTRYIKKFKESNSGRITKHVLVDVICKLEMRIHILNNRLISRSYQDVAPL